IRPIHPDGAKLRFNWNAAIAHDPFDKTTIYYGSQFIHKSNDRGDNWTIISPDLSTNDPEKQKQNESGGLTYDITSAENHCTIIAISPSPIRKNEIWAGTDDGNVQLTRDGGNTWENLTPNIKGAPKNAWIPMIHVSNHQEGEAFVVLNHYRLNDFSAYLYHTRNYGTTWTRLADDTKVFGYCLSVVQDPVEPKLIFLGTEHGLFVSVDYGATWTKWTRGYPNVSTMDLKIHPREHDLLIGTFGRSAYILDDIRPLRALAAEGPAILEQEIRAYPSPVAYHIGSQNQSGVYGSGSGYFQGQTKSLAGILTYSVREPIKRERPADEATPSTAQATARAGRGGMGTGGFAGFGARGGEGRNVEPVRIEIFNNAGEKIRTLQDFPQAGLNKASWRLDEKSFSQAPPTQQRMGGSQEQGGLSVTPGKYLVKYSYRNHSDSTWIEVRMDPRVPFRPEHLEAKREFVMAFQKKADKLTEATELIRQAQEAADLVMKQIPAGRSDELRALREETQTVQDTLKALMHKINPERPADNQRASPAEYNLRNQVTRAISAASSGFGELTGTQRRTVELAEIELLTMLKRIDQFFTETWPAFRQRIENAPVSLFKDKPYSSLSW
ncbi:MAG: hypothetical protein R6V75_01510, partial [Bacteroidales bacterium]